MKKALLVVDLQEEYFENEDFFKNQFKLDMSNFHQKTFNSIDEYMNSVNKIIENNVNNIFFISNIPLRHNFCEHLSKLYILL